MDDVDSSFLFVNLQVDKVVVNKYWGLVVPDSSQLTAVSPHPAYITDTAERYEF